MVKQANKDPLRGERIRYVRKEILGLRSQDDFASWVGDVTRGAVGNWERGLDIGLDNLIAIADKAKISLEWLARGEGKRPVKGQSHQGSSPRSEELASALASYESLPPGERKKFLKHVLDL